jgi:hypothetical protein
MAERSLRANYSEPVGGHALGRVRQPAVAQQLIGLGWKVRPATRNGSAYAGVSYAVGDPCDLFSLTTRGLHRRPGASTHGMGNGSRWDTSEHEGPSVDEMSLAPRSARIATTAIKRDSAASLLVAELREATANFPVERRATMLPLRVRRSLQTSPKGSQQVGATDNRGDHDVARAGSARDCYERATGLPEGDLCR